MQEKHGKTVVCAGKAWKNVSFCGKNMEQPWLLQEKHGKSLVFVGKNSGKTGGCQTFHSLPHLREGSGAAGDQQQSAWGVRFIQTCSWCAKTNKVKKTNCFMISSKIKDFVSLKKKKFMSVFYSCKVSLLAKK